MPQKIVASVRMSHAGIAEGSGGRYLARARALTARAEALGATLVAWSATTFAFAWDIDAIDDAIAFSAGLNEDAPSEEQAWASGVAEGELELLSATGQRGELAWGPALVCAVSLARIAKPGETLVDGDVRAMRTGELGNVGTRVSTDAGKRVRGWRLDLKRPWKHPSAARMARIVQPPAPPVDPDGTEPFPVPMIERLERAAPDLESTDERPLPSFPLDPLDLVDNAIEVQRPTVPDMRPSVVPSGGFPPPAPPPTGELRSHLPPLGLAHKLLAEKPSVASIVALRRARTRAEGASPNVRCHASLALAVSLARANRPEEALLEGLDALARAREAGEPRAEDACLAFLARLARGMGHVEAANELLDRASPSRR